MDDTIYTRLREYIDSMPAGYPATPSGADFPNPHRKCMQPFTRSLTGLPVTDAKNVHKNARLMPSLPRIFRPRRKSMSTRWTRTVALDAGFAWGAALSTRFP